MADELAEAQARLRAVERELKHLAAQQKALTSKKQVWTVVGGLAGLGWVLGAGDGCTWVWLACARLPPCRGKAVQGLVPLPSPKPAQPTNPLNKQPTYESCRSWRERRRRRSARRRVLSWTWLTWRTSCRETQVRLEGLLYLVAWCYVAAVMLLSTWLLAVLHALQLLAAGTALHPAHPPTHHCHPTPATLPGTRQECEAELAKLERRIAAKEKELDKVQRQLATAQQQQAALGAELAGKERRLKALYEKQGRGAQVRLCFRRECLL